MHIDSRACARACVARFASHCCDDLSTAALHRKVASKNHSSVKVPLTDGSNSQQPQDATFSTRR